MAGPAKNTGPRPSAFAELGLAKTVAALAEEVRELYLCDAAPWVVGYSGGKDSSAVLQLVWLAVRDLPPDQRRQADPRHLHRHTGRAAAGRRLGGHVAGPYARGGPGAGAADHAAQAHP